MALTPEEWRRALALSGAGSETLGMFDGVDDETLRLAREEAARREREEQQRAVERVRGDNLASGMSDQELARALTARNGAPIGATENDPGYAAKVSRGSLGPVDVSAQDDPELAQALAATRNPRQLPPAAAEARAAYQALPPTDVAPGRVRERPSAPEGGGELGPAKPAPRFDTGRLPPETNRALEATGSDLRVPEYDSMPRQKGSIAGDSLARQAEIRGQQATATRESAGRAREAIGERRQKQDAFEAAAVERLNRITKLVDNPPEPTRNSGRLIMGAILNMASQGRVSDGRAEMAHELQQNVENWKREIAGNKEAMGLLLELSKHHGGEAERQTRIEHGLLEYEMGALNSSLEQEKLRAQSQQEYLAAEQAQQTLAKAYVRTRLFTMSLPELKAHMDAGDLDEEGQKIYADRVKSGQEIEKNDIELQKGRQGLRKGEQDLAMGPLEMEAKMADIEGKRADAEKKRAEAAEKAAANRPGARVAGGFEVADPQIWNGATAGTRSDFERGTSNVPGLVKQMRSLKSMVEEYGTEGTWTDAGAKMSTLSAGIMGGYKEAEKLGALDKGVVEMVERLIGDVNSMKPEWWSNVEARLDQAIAQTTENNVAKASALGLRRMQLKPDQSAPAPSPERGVIIRTPDGRRMRIPERSLDKALELGAQVIGG